MTDFSTANQCSTCAKSYKRPEHLRRHQLSHSAERPYECKSCNSTFKRSDVLKRHLETCEVDSTAPSRPNAKKQAISRAPCSSGPRPNRAEQVRPTRHHEDTDSVLPTNDVGSCTEGGHEPSVEHLTGWITSGLSGASPPDFYGDAWHDFLDFNSGVQTPYESSDSPQQHIDSFHFLENFTSNTGLVRSFDCGTNDQRDQIVANFLKSQETLKETTNLKHTLSAGLTEQCTITSVAAAARFTPPSEANPDLAILHSWLSDPLSLKSHEITNLVREVIEVKPRNSSVTLTWSSSLHEICWQFFAPTNIRKFLELYWAAWHPNVNFVHRPTFDPLSSKPALIAAMALIGACVSPDQVDSDNAKRWFNCIEEVVFRDDDFCDDNPVTLRPGFSELGSCRGRLQALQASYMVCLFQNWEGADQSKRRIRRYRYSTVVAVARDIGIQRARHPNYCQQDLCDFRWHDFVVREEFIRLCLWIFLLDTAFVIFNNLPPRMVIKEMKMQMACSEACFQCEIPEECHKILRNEALARKPSSKVEFCSAIEILCKDSIGEETCVILADLGPLNLFTMTSALHSLIFHYQNSFSCQGLLVPIQNALLHWKMTWEVYANQMSSDRRHTPIGSQNITPDNMWKRIGFMRYASEYWLLANLMVGRLTASTQRSHNFDADASAAQSVATTLGDESVDPILSKYDETSMRQVNELISAFQKVMMQ